MQKTNETRMAVKFVCAVFLLLLWMQGRPAFAQLDIAGEWQEPGGSDLAFHEETDDRAGGPEIGDYLGLPLNEAGIFKAENYSASWLEMPEHQCMPHPSTYAYHGPGALTFVKEYDPNTQLLVAYHIYGSYGLERVIWMDGRPHPPAEAPHMYTGFSTGKWVGDKLMVETTHLKQSWLRRNGSPLSDRAKMIEYFIRHDDWMTDLIIIDDPVYLTEPHIRSSDYKRSPRPALKLSQFGNFVVGGTGAVYYKCFATEEIASTVKHRVPSFMPGKNPFLDDFAKNAGIPTWVAHAGDETLYPEIMEKMKQPNAKPMFHVRASPPDFDQPPAPGVRSLHVAGQVWMISGAGGNIAVQVGKEGVLLVDTGLEAMSDQVNAEVHKIAGDKPIRVIINTHDHADHTGGNTKVGAGPTPDSQRPSIIAFENVSIRMAQQAGIPSTSWPTDTFYTDSHSIYFNDEPIDIIHVPSAHTDGDVLVYFRKSDVLAAGDVLITTLYPVIDLDEGGSFQGIIDALNRIIEITVAEYREEGGTLVIPGHGRVYDEADVADYRDMATIVRDRIQDAIKRGRTPEQMKAEGMTRDYDGRYGATSGFWTTDMFLDAAYRSLMNSK